MDWKTELNNAVTQEIKTKNINQIKIPFHKINLKTLFFITIGITIFILIMGPILTFAIFPQKGTMSIKKIVIVEVIIFLIGFGVNITIFIFLKKQELAKKMIKNTINSDINLLNYYDKAIKTEVNPKLTAVNITSSFQNWPIFLNKYAFHEMVTNDVLNMSHPDYELSIGAITERFEYEETTTDGHTITKYEYYRRLILTGRYIKSFDVSAYIHPANILNKLYKGSNNVSLESPEFNKLFNITSNNQITIRKLITPKVILNLIELVKKEKKNTCPFIAIEENEIAMISHPFKVMSYYDSSYLIGKINISNEINEIAQNYVETIVRDLNVMNKFFEWLNALDISLK